MTICFSSFLFSFLLFFSFLFFLSFLLLFACFVFVLVVVFVFQDRVSLCSPGCPGTHFVDQAGLELRNPPASASRVLGLKACATMPGSRILFLNWEFYRVLRSSFWAWMSVVPDLAYITENKIGLEYMLTPRVIPLGIMSVYVLTDTRFFSS